MTDFPDEVKEEVREKSDHTCIWCNKREHFTHVHHIKPQKEGGSGDFDNAALLCPNCHTEYGSNPDLRQEVKRRRDTWYKVVADKRRSMLDEKIKHLVAIRDVLRGARSEYNDYLTDHPQGDKQDESWHKKIINRAIEVCQDADDRDGCEECLEIHAGELGFDECSRRCEKRLAYIAKMRLTPYFVEEPTDGQRKAELSRWGWYGNRNKNALRDAVDRVDDLIRERQQEKA